MCKAGIADKLHVESCHKLIGSLPQPTYVKLAERGPATQLQHTGKTGSAVDTADMAGRGSHPWQEVKREQVPVAEA